MTQNDDPSLKKDSSLAELRKVTWYHSAGTKQRPQTMPTLPSISKSMYLETDHEYATCQSSMTVAISSPIKLYNNKQIKTIPLPQMPENRKTVNSNQGDDKTPGNVKCLHVRGRDTFECRKKSIIRNDKQEVGGTRNIL